jgi:hypothetical protein
VLSWGVGHHGGCTFRPPQRTGGQPNDDFTLPPALYWDAVYFVEQARLNSGYTQDRFLRAALYAAFASFEATLNQAAFGHAAAHASVLGQIERDVLEERETIVDDRGHIVRRTKYYPLEARLSFLALFLSGQDFDRGTALWTRFREARQLRDEWTHPKPPFDTWSLTVSQVEQAIATLKEVLVELSRLMGEDPPLWLTPAEEVLGELQARRAETHPQDDTP